jgi:Ca-activated chloride channel family protein
MPNARSRTGIVFLVFVLLACTSQVVGQPGASQQDQPTYRLKLPVDEVSLTFQATDDQGRAIDDLRIDDLKLLDNGVAVRRIVSFESIKEDPVRVGILMDSSESMASNLEHGQNVAAAVLRGLLLQPADRAFVMDFGALSLIAQDWTGDSTVLESAIRNHKVASNAGSSLGGTALLDSLYRACLNEFGHTDSSASRNVIILFSDGVDNSSRGDIRLAVDECQKTNTAIFAFRFDTPAASTGPATLAELATKTGGRVFHGDDAETQIADDIRLVESELHNRYRLTFKPPEVKHDGAFHHIELMTPARLVYIYAQSGYYTPLR